jgi:hypothetical protein
LTATNGRPPLWDGESTLRSGTERMRAPTGRARRPPGSTGRSRWGTRMAAPCSRTGRWPAGAATTKRRPRDVCLGHLGRHPLLCALGDRQRRLLGREHVRAGDAAGRDVSGGRGRHRRRRGVSLLRRPDER